MPPGGGWVFRRLAAVVCALAIANSPAGGAVSQRSEEPAAPAPPLLALRRLTKAASALAEAGATAANATVASAAAASNATVVNATAEANAVAVASAAAAGADVPANGTAAANATAANATAVHSTVEAIGSTAANATAEGGAAGAAASPGATGNIFAGFANAIAANASVKANATAVFNGTAVVAGRAGGAGDGSAGVESAAAPASTAAMTNGVDVVGTNFTPTGNGTAASADAAATAGAKPGAAASGTATGTAGAGAAGNRSAGLPSAGDGAAAAGQGPASGTPPLFDCVAGLQNWQRGWSEAKIDYCCEHVGQPCRTTVSTTPKDAAAEAPAVPAAPTAPAAPAPAAPAPAAPAAPAPAAPAASLAPAAPAPAAPAPAAPAPAAQAPTAPAAPPAPAAPAAPPAPPAAEKVSSSPFDCEQPEPRGGWPEVTRRWCCQNRGLACKPTSTSEPFDCKSNRRTNKKTDWSHQKAAYCCEHHKSGCGMIKKQEEDGFPGEIEAKEAEKAAAQRKSQDVGVPRAAGRQEEGASEPPQSMAHLSTAQPEGGHILPYVMFCLVLLPALYFWFSCRRKSSYYTPKAPRQQVKATTVGRSRGVYTPPTLNL